MLPQVTSCLRQFYSGGGEVIPVVRDPRTFIIPIPSNCHSRH